MHLGARSRHLGTGLDMSQLFTEQATLRAEELGVADRVTFIHGDAAGYVIDEKVDVQPVSATRSPGSRRHHRAL